MTESTQTKKPVNIRHGTIHAAIWTNEGKHGPNFNVTVKRRYRDAEGEWKTTDGFGFEHLLSAAKVFNEAHSVILQLKQTETPTAANKDGNEKADGSRSKTAANAAATKAASGRGSR